VVELALGWQVAGENRLGQEGEADSVGYLLWLLVTGDGLLHHSHPDECSLPVVVDKTGEPPERGSHLDGLWVGELLQDLHLALAELEPHADHLCILDVEKRDTEV